MNKHLIMKHIYQVRRQLAISINNENHEQAQRLQGLLLVTYSDLLLANEAEFILSEPIELPKKESNRMGDRILNAYVFGLYLLITLFVIAGYAIERG